MAVSRWCAARVRHVHTAAVLFLRESAPALVEEQPGRVRVRIVAEEFPLAEVHNALRDFMELLLEEG
jgi:hypothetical protein